MPITVLNPIISKRANLLIQSIESQQIFHLPFWAKTIYDSYGYQPLYFTDIRNSKIESLLPMMEVNSFITGKKGVSLPFTDECQPMIPNCQSFKSLFNAVTTYGKKKKWRYIEFRGGHSFFQKKSFYSKFFTHHLKLNTDNESLFNDFKSNTKRNIKKALKSNITIKFNNTLEGIDHFYRLNCLTRKHHGLPPQPLFFFHNLFKHIIAKNHGNIVLAYSSNLPIAGAIFIHSSKTAIYKYGASHRDYLFHRPNHLVMWEAIKWYASNGFYKLSFGRTDPHNKGLLRFKRSWNSTEISLKYHRFDLKKYSFSTSQPQLKSSYRIFKLLPICLSRIVGRILYRHVG